MNLELLSLSGSPKISSLVNCLHGPYSGRGTEFSRSFLSHANEPIQGVMVLLKSRNLK